MISAHFTFSKHWFAISCTQFLFCSAFQLLCTTLIFSFVCEMWTGVFPYTYFVSDYTCKNLTVHQETLRPPQLVRSDQLGLPLETSCFVSTKILWYFVNFLLTSEWLEDANWTNTHTHTNDTTAERNLDFKLSPCTECCILSFGWFLGVWNLYADVSEHSVPSS